MLAERAFATVQQLLRSQRSDRALIALRKRKLHDNQVLHVETCILRIDEQLASVEGTSQQMAVVAALRTANGAIKQMQQQMRVEDIEKLMDESADAAAYLVCVSLAAHRIEIPARARSAVLDALTASGMRAGGGAGRARASAATRRGAGAAGRAGGARGRGARGGGRQTACGRQGAQSAACSWASRQLSSAHMRWLAQNPQGWKPEQAAKPEEAQAAEEAREEELDLPPAPTTAAVMPTQQTEVEEQREPVLA